MSKSTDAKSEPMKPNPKDPCPIVLAADGAYAMPLVYSAANRWEGIQK